MKASLVIALIAFSAYTLDGVTDLRTRPVTFLYNGDPGSATLWLHMGSVGPVRIVTASPNATGAPPYELVATPGTGFSRPVGWHGQGLADFYSK